MQGFNMVKRIFYGLFVIFICFILRDFMLVPFLEKLISDLSLVQMQNQNGIVETINFYKLIISLSWWIRPVCIGSVVTYWLISWKEDR